MKPCLVWRMPCDSQTSSSCISWELTVWPPFLLSSALFAEVQPFSRNWWSHLCVSSHPRDFTLAISSLEYPPPSLLSFAPFIPIYLSSVSWVISIFCGTALYFIELHKPPSLSHSFMYVKLYFALFLN